MKFILLSTALFSLAALQATVCRAGPVEPSALADRKSEADSVDDNEVGPEEDWTLLQRMSKTNSYDQSDADKTRALIKEIEEFTRLVKQANGTADDGLATTTDRPSPLDEDVTEYVTESDPASSVWTGATWRGLLRGDDDESTFRTALSDRQEDDGTVEEIIKKLSDDLRKLINSARGINRGLEEPFTLAGGASESDGVFVIDDTLVGESDKSSKYTVPIYSD